MFQLHNLQAAYAIYVLTDANDKNGSLNTSIWYFLFSCSSSSWSTKTFIRIWIHLYWFSLCLHHLFSEYSGWPILQWFCQIDILLLMHLYFFLQQYEWLVGAQYKPMEMSKSDWAAIRKSPPWSIDSWGLGKCIIGLSWGFELLVLHWSLSWVINLILDRIWS